MTKEDASAMRDVRQNDGPAGGGSARRPGGAEVRELPAAEAWQAALDAVRTTNKARKSVGRSTSPGPLTEQILKAEAKAKRESLEAAMGQQLRAAGLVFDTQVQFHPVRKWRMDFVVAPQSRRPVAIEVQGGTYTQGRHTRGQGYENDCEKAFHAQLLGWRVLHVTGHTIRSGKALEWVLRLLDVCHA